MQEINHIWLKYAEGRLLDGIQSLEDANQLALTFGKDVAHTFKLITLLQNSDTSPCGYDLSDAPVIGLLTRVAKLFRLVCRFYELKNADYLSVFSRPLIESSIIATYILREGVEGVEDFRRCSYKDTLRILRDHESGSEFLRTPAGQRVLKSARTDFVLENLSKDSFVTQKRNRWRLQGKSIYEIFVEVASVEEYPFVYGMLSESIHGSWNESMDWCLYRNDDGTFSTNALFIDVDARSILPLVRYATPPYALWIERTRPQDAFLKQTLDRIQECSREIFFKFDDLYDGSTTDGSVFADPS